MTVSPVEAVTGKGVIYARPYDHETVEIHWSVPKAVQDTWLEVAIVRSVYGAPSTVMDGVTIFRGLKADLFPTGVPANSVGNQLVLPVFDRNVPEGFDSPTMDGLNPGRWYYYSLFFRSDVWQRVMSASTVLPRNHHHGEHLWNRLPPHYQMTDDQFRDGDGYLRRFLNVFGYELDTAREYVEQWQELYHIDATPMALLRRLGENFDLPYEAGLGDIRYRGLMAQLGHLYDIRGTPQCLGEVICSGSQYECEITTGYNLMLLTDDSDFLYGTGNWASYHPDAATDPIDPGLGIEVTIVQPEDMDLYVEPTAEPPEMSSRGVMRMRTTQAVATVPVILTCGCGMTSDQSEAGMGPIREILPRTAGIPVIPGTNYGFQIQILMAIPSPVYPFLLWYGAGGGIDDLILPFTPIISYPPVTPTPWETLTIHGLAPEGAAYLVPGLEFTDRVAGADPAWSPNVDLAGAMVWEVGTGSEEV